MPIPGDVQHIKYGTKQDMVDLNPNDLSEGDLFITETDVFRWDPTVIDDETATFQNTNIVDSIRPGAPLTISSYYAKDVAGSWNPEPYTGRWVSQTQNRNEVDAYRCFGLSETNNGVPYMNADLLQLAINEAASIGRELVVLPPGVLEIDRVIYFHHQATIPNNPANRGNPEFPLPYVDNVVPPYNPPIVQLANFGGKLTLRGAGSGTFQGHADEEGGTPYSAGTLLHSTVPDFHSFVMGKGNGNYGFSLLKMEHLAMRAEHEYRVWEPEDPEADPPEEVPYVDQWSICFLNYPQDFNVFRDVTFIQEGRGNGLLCLSAFHTELYQVRALLKNIAPAVTEEKSVGIWIRNEGGDDAFSGVVNLVNVTCGPTNYDTATFHERRRWKRGIVLGDGAGGGRLYCGQAIGLSITNADEGIVVGKDVAEAVLIGPFVEHCHQCAIRIYNGARRTTVRGYVGINSRTDEGDIVIGKGDLGYEDPPTVDADYAEVVVENVEQVVMRGPAVRVWAGPGSGPVAIRHVVSGGGDGARARASVQVDDSTSDQPRVPNFTVEHALSLVPGKPGVDAASAKRIMRLTYTGKNAEPAASEREYTTGATHTLDAQDVLYHRVDVSGANRSFNLPSATERPGLEFHFVVFRNNPFQVPGTATLVPQSGQTIGGASSLALSQGQSARIRSNGTNWDVVARA